MPLRLISGCVARHVQPSVGMLTAVLQAPNRNQNQSIQSDHFKSSGPTIYDAKGQPIVMQQAGIWRNSSGIYISLDFSSVTVHFHNEELGQSEKFGPYPKLRIINGGMWAIDEMPELIAQFDALLNLWHIVERPATGMTEFTVTG
jgi:hypothetical protein